MKLQIVFALLVLGAASCGKKQEPDASKAAGSAAGQPAGQLAAAAPKQDFSKPYLTDDNVQRFIASMKEARNPFGFIFKDRGEVRDLSDLKARVEELNAFARKHGFKDYEDYITVSARITMAMMLQATDAMTKGITDMTKGMHDQMLKQAEEALKQPNLDPEMRKMYQEQVESSKKALAEAGKETGGIEAARNEGVLNDADLAIIKKHKAQLDQVWSTVQAPPDEE